jgi:plastocyanin
MKKTTKLTLTLLAVAAVVVVAIMIADGAKNDTKDTSNSSSNSSSSASTSDESSSADDEVVAATITYDGNGFSASTDTIKAGDKVRVVNDSDQPLDFDSDPHPRHTDNTELNVGDIEPGSSQVFTIDKAGTWGYHNHLSASQNGSITVTE